MDHRELTGRFSTLNKFFKSYFGYLALVDYCSEIDQSYLGLHPYTHINNTLLCDATIQWCKLFGTDSESTHWKKLVVDHEDFRRFLFQKTTHNQSEFRKYQLSMLEFRDKWVAHYESSFPHGSIPEFELALNSALALQDYLQMNKPEGYDYSGVVSVEGFGRSFGMALLDPLKHAIKT
ncbi:hypothetical protein VIBRN418_08207 [Vibrio sp. N418]|uniref:hypothetical protein n=1 Tax=Vibrio sp. (strain N418) TaxID=701176 RepID=UPI00021BFA0B|nr:hypothetical protein [Vibrio sp. N418]EGU37318.1 hypothetical protein VIBRN418_08207 [Vibrio sp. N418]